MIIEKTEIKTVEGIPKFILNVEPICQINVIVTGNNSSAEAVYLLTQEDFDLLAPVLQKAVAAVPGLQNVSAPVFVDGNNPCL